MQKAAVALVLFFATAEGLLIEGLQAAEEPTFWDMGDGDKLETYHFHPRTSDVLAMKKDHAEKVKQSAQESLRQEHKQEKPSSQQKTVEEQPRQTAEEAKIMAKEKELQRLTEDLQEALAIAPTQEKGKKSKTIHEKAPKGETVKEKHERHEQERLAAVESKKAAVDADETAHKITAAEKELQDLYKEQLSEKMAAPVQNEHKHKNSKHDQRAQAAQQEATDKIIQQQVDERLAAVKGAIADIDAGEEKPLQQLVAERLAATPKAQIPEGKQPVTKQAEKLQKKAAQAAAKEQLRQEKQEQKEHMKQALRKQKHDAEEQLNHLKREAKEQLHHSKISAKHAGTQATPSTPDMFEGGSYIE